MMKAQFSPTYSRVPKIQSLNTSHVGATNLKHAHVFTSIGHDDGRDYASPDDYPMVIVHELNGIAAAGDHETAESGDVLSHNGVTYDGTSWYTADRVKLYKWSAIGATPTADGTNPSNLDPITALEADTGLSGFNHFGDIDYVEIDGSGYIAVPVVRRPQLDIGGICLYDTSLSYVNGSYSDMTSTTGHYLGACAVDPVGGRVFFTNADEELPHSKLYVCNLDGLLDGTMTIQEEITLNYPILVIQGISVRGEEIFIEWNNTNQRSITVFDFSGNPLRTYRAFEISGPEGIHVHGDTLYWLVSSGEGQGNIKTYDIAAAQKPGSRPDGRRLNNPDVSTPLTDMAMQTFKKAAVGDQGTIVRRIKLKTHDTSFIGGTSVDNNDFWAIQAVIASLNVRVRFFLDGGGALIETSPSGTSDDLPVDEEHTIAITWNRIAADNIELQIFLDGVLKDSDTETDSANWSDFQGWSIGRGYTDHYSADMVVYHDYVYDAVLDADTLLAIHNDPYGMWNTA